MGTVIVLSDHLFYIQCTYTDHTCLRNRERNFYTRMKWP